MSISQTVRSFSAGELSPLLHSRTDSERYTQGCRTLLNMIPLPYGAAMRRPGTEWMGPTKHSDKLAVLIEFNFSTATRFVLEFGEGYIRFWSNGMQVEDPGTPGSPLEVATPYQAEDLRTLQYVQINDIMYLAHPSYPPAKLTRLADDDWTYAAVSPVWPALSESSNTQLTITNDLSGGYDAQTDVDFFRSDHVGAIIQASKTRDTAYQKKKFDTEGSTGGMVVTGGWSITTYGTWGGDLIIERSYDNLGWSPIRTFHVESDRNISAAGNEMRQCWLRIRFTNRTAGGSSDYAILDISDPTVYNLFAIDAVTDAQNAKLSPISVPNLITTFATDSWSEAAWSEVRGYPRVVELHDGRIFWGGTRASPLTVWASALDDYENFRIGPIATEGLRISIAAAEASGIQWIESRGKELIIGTASMEGALYAAEQGAAISPTNVAWQKRTRYGSEGIQPIEIGDSVIFLQRRGRKAREYIYSEEFGNFVGTDLTVLAEHISRGGIVDWAASQQEEGIVWAIRSDGTLLSMTYARDQGIVAWARHETAGAFESVAVIHGDGTDDEVWCVVRREIDGETKRFIERFRPDWKAIFEEEDKASWWYVDCGKRFDAVGGTTISGLDHLEGKDVQILADGATTPGKTVSDGEITLDEAANTAIVGLPFESRCQPMLINPDGRLSGRKARIDRVVADVYKSLGGEYSTDGGASWDAFLYRGEEDDMDDSPPPYTGETEEFAAGGYTNGGADVMIRQTAPMPLCLRAIIAKFLPSGD